MLTTPTKAEWNALKKQHGIPDGIGRTSVGNAIDRFLKISSKTVFDKIPTERVKPLNELIVAVKDYRAAAEKRFPNKKDFLKEVADLQSICSRDADSLTRLSQPWLKVSDAMRNMGPKVREFAAAKSDAQAENCLVYIGGTANSVNQAAEILGLCDRVFDQLVPVVKQLTAAVNAATKAKGAKSSRKAVLDAHAALMRITKKLRLTQ
jgi:hypothetical protein